MVIRNSKKIWEKGEWELSICDIHQIQYQQFFGNIWISKNKSQKKRYVGEIPLSKAFSYNVRGKASKKSRNFTLLTNETHRERLQNYSSFFLYWNKYVFFLCPVALQLLPHKHNNFTEVTVENKKNVIKDKNKKYWRKIKDKKKYYMYLENVKMFKVNCKIG